MLLALRAQIYLSESICLSECLLACVRTCRSVCVKRQLVECLVFLARGGFRLQDGMHSKSPRNNLFYGKNDQQKPLPILLYQI